jgi:hypothetical protein
MPANFNLKNQEGTKTFSNSEGTSRKPSTTSSSDGTKVFQIIVLIIV